jgi:hypothetical protein
MKPIDYRQSFQVWRAVLGDSLLGRGILYHCCCQFFSSNTSIHGFHDPSKDTREYSPRCRVSELKF